MPICLPPASNWLLDWAVSAGEAVVAAAVADGAVSFAAAGWEAAAVESFCFQNFNADASVPDTHVHAKTRETERIFESRVRIRAIVMTNQQ